MKDKLEKAFHDALINQEVAYDPKAWEALKKQLPGSKMPWYTIGGAAAVVAISAGLWWTFTKNNEESKSTEVQSKKSEFVAPNENNQSAQDHSNILTENPSSNPATDKIRAVYQSNVNQTTQANGIFIKPGNTQTLTSNPDESSASVAQNSSAPTTKNNPQPVETNTNPAVRSKDFENIEIIGIQNSYCENGLVQLRVSNAPQNSDVNWRLSNGKTIRGVVAEFKAERGLEVNVEIQNKDRANENYNNRMKLNVVEAQKPIIEVNFREQNTKNYVTLSNNNPSIEHIVWRFESNTCKNSSCGTYLTTKGTHEYLVESYDKNGCFAAVKGDVEIKEDYNLFAQKAFSPNGDGLNDNFMPEALKSRAVNFKLSLFDKTGRLIYMTTDVHSPWDGRWNGQILGSDTFVWTVSLINEEGKPEMYTGTVTIVQ